jgi:hypothetical protein
MIRCLASTVLLCLSTLAPAALAQDGACVNGLAIDDVRVSTEPETPCLGVDVQTGWCGVATSVVITNDCAAELTLGGGLTCGSAGAPCVLLPGESASDGVDTGDEDGAPIERTYLGSFPDGDVTIHVSFRATRGDSDGESGCGGSEQAASASPRPFALAGALPWLLLLRRGRRRPARAERAPK